MIDDIYIDRQITSFRSLIHSPKSPQKQEFEPGQGRELRIQPSCYAWVAATRLPESSPLPCRVCFSRELEAGARARDQAHILQGVMWLSYTLD